MTRYVVRRLTYGALTFLGITVVVFALIHLVPGDPVRLYTRELSARHLAPGALDVIRHNYGLDRPLAVQYGRWLTGALRFDFGRSLSDSRPVMEIVAEKLPNTLLLNVLAFVIAAALGIPIGLWGSANMTKRGDRALSAVLLILYSLPSFWVAVLLMRWLALDHQWLPMFGATSYDYAMLSPWQQFVDRLAHLILPTVTLAYGQLAIFARFSKATVDEVVRQDYITAARARGITAGRLLWHHAFRNALMPLITLLGLTVPYLASGSVIVERIFQWDGIGRLYFDSVQNRDYPVVLALTVLTAVATLMASLLADVLYAAADPRVRLEETLR